MSVPGVMNRHEQALETLEMRLESWGLLSEQIDAYEAIGVATCVESVACLLIRNFCAASSAVWVIVTVDAAAVIVGLVTVATCVLIVVTVLIKSAFNPSDQGGTSHVRRVKLNEAVFLGISRKSLQKGVASSGAS